MQFTRKTIYKAKDPVETISEIRNTLNDLDIFISENSIYHKASQTCACGIRFGDEAFNDSIYATNGKGMNARYALASAYGEMMERLESGILTRGDRKAAYLDGKIGSYIAPDEKKIKLSELPGEAVATLKELIKISDEDYSALTAPLADKEIFCVPYRDVLGNREVLLPIDLYFMFFTSTGLCAGNTYEEAFCQGLSEVFERASLAAIYGENLTLRRLPPEWFEGTDVLARLEHLKTLGYDYAIIDASLDKKYPVIGLQLKKEEKVMADFGADPDPVVALERCLTELFQCIQEGSQDLRLTGESCGLWSDWKLNVQKSWYYSQFYSAKTLNSGLKPDNLFHIPENYSKDYTCSHDLTDYEYYIKLIRELGYHLYVRDFSYLGFPALQVFVPEISLGDFYTEVYPARLSGYLTGAFGPKVSSPEAQAAILPILKKIEERQAAFYLK